MENGGNGNSSSSWTRWDFSNVQPKFHQFEFEQVDSNYWNDISELHGTSLILASSLTYLTLIWWVRGFMENRGPFHLRIPLITWNILVALFSITASARVGTELWIVLKTVGFYEGVCLRVGGHVSSVFWAVATFFMKIALLTDTMFLLLRRKPVDAGHVVHHILAIAFCGKVSGYGEPIYRWMGFANLVTHSIDYTLLALTAMKIPLPKYRQIMVALEVMQMLFIILTSAYTIILRASGTVCMRHPTSVALSNGMALVILGFAIAKIVSAEYWKRGGKGNKSCSLGTTSTNSRLKKKLE